MGDAIEIRGMTKTFGKKIAVNNINLDIKQNEIFSLLGVNGAGKTTTIKILTGLSKPDTGTAKIFDYDIEKDLKKIKPLINISTQETAIAPNLTVKENLAFIADIYGMKKEEKDRAVENSVKQFSLEDVARVKAKTLSGGYQRKVSIAMAAITSPKVLFLDEPTLGLDVLARRELWRGINKLKENTTIILTTHYMEEAEYLSDTVAVMVKGEIKDIGTVDGLKKKYDKDRLEDVFVEIAEEGME